MKTVRLQKEQYPLFAYLDPLEVGDYLAFPGWFAVGVFFSVAEMGESVNRNLAEEDDFYLEDGEPIEGDIPVGWMILSDRSDALSIEWMAVDPLVRYRGVGEWMLKVARGLSAELGYRKLKSYYRQELPYYNLVLAYLSDRGFTDGGSMGGEYNSFVGTLLKQNGKTAPPDGAGALMDVQTAPLVRIFEKLDKKKDAVRLYSIAGWQNLADRKCSVLLLDEEEPLGGVIIQKIHDTLYPVFMWAESPKDLSDLFMDAMDRAFKEYGETVSVQMILREGDDAGLGKLFLPGAQIRNRYLTAPVTIKG